jgi:hypothetical protein
MTMDQRFAQRTFVVPLVLAALLSGCLLAACTGVGQVSPAAAHGTDQEHRQANEALARWTLAVQAGGGRGGFVPVEEMTGQVGDWELEVGDNNKRALMAGMVVEAAPLPGQGAGEAKVRWADGTTRSMPTISAEQAFQAVKATGTADCPDCVPLRVTSARLSTATIQTSRGPASAPAWEFTLEGTKVLVTRIAVAPDQAIVVAPPPWDPNNAPSGLSVESATGTVGAKQLIVAFTGAPDAGDKSCGADYSAEAVESGTAVVVIVIPHENGFLGACSAVGARRTATVALAEPLGDRAVLEVRQGLPISVLLTP